MLGFRTIASQRPRRRGRWSRALCLLCLGVPVLLGAIRLPAQALTVGEGIFLYTSSGVEDVSATYQCLEHHVYDPDGILVGYVGVDNRIYNTYYQAIGYIVSQP